jgi:hypothetical protein
MTWKDAPYVFLAQSRAEMNTTLCSLIVYVSAFLPAVKLISPSAAAAVMIPVQFIALINNIITQMFPMFEKLMDTFGILLALLVYRRRKEKIGDVVYSMVQTTGPNIIVEKYWFNRMLCCRQNEPLQRMEESASDGIVTSRWSTDTEADADVLVKIADEGVIIGECSSTLFPDDHDARMLVQFKNGMVLGLLSSEFTYEFGEALDKSGYTGHHSCNIQDDDKVEKGKDSRQEMEMVHIDNPMIMKTDKDAGKKKFNNGTYL